MNKRKRVYRILIQWSDEDGVYVVSLPDFGPYCKTHGATYEEAAKNGEEVLELLVESRSAEAMKYTPSRTRELK